MAIFDPLTWRYVNFSPEVDEVIHLVESIRPGYFESRFLVKIISLKEGGMSRPGHLLESAGLSLGEVQQVEMQGERPW